MTPSAISVAEGCGERVLQRTVGLLFFCFYIQTNSGGDNSGTTNILLGKRKMNAANEGFMPSHNGSQVYAKGNDAFVCHPPDLKFAG